MSGGVPAGCICGQRFAMCEDSHAIDCPASSQYATWLKMRGTLTSAHTPTPPIEGRDADLERVVARAIRQAIVDARKANDAALAKGGFWPDNHYMPPDTDLARAALQALGERG